MFDGLGGIVSSAFNFLGAQQTNADRVRIANDANAFSAQQYATRYQTQTQDMQAAGLNPMLAYQQGPGSSPTGQQAQVENPYASAAEGYHQSKQRDLLAAQVQNVNEDTEVKRSQAKINDEQAKLIGQQTIESKSRERQADTSATESTYRLWSEQNVKNPTQKALAASYWSQIEVNKANLPKIASEIVSNGAHAHLARARAAQAIAEEKITRADLDRALNEQAMERGAFGKVKPYVNSAGKIKDLLPSKSTTVRESPWGNSKSTTYSR